MHYNLKKAQFYSWPLFTICSTKAEARATPTIGVGIGGARGAMAPPIISVQMPCITVFEIIKEFCAAVSQ